MAGMVLLASGFSIPEIRRMLDISMDHFIKLQDQSLDHWRHDSEFRATYDRIMAQVAEMSHQPQMKA